MMRLFQARQLGWVLCRTCDTAIAERSFLELPRCPRCHSSVRRRKASSSELTWAWLLTAVICYLPANLLPVMHTSGLNGEADSTIVGGIIEFWRAGDWDIALLIFLASVAVPFTKFIAIALLLITVQAGSRWEQHQRARLYRIVEFIGYWSMLDVIVVAITSALMQFGALGTAEPRAGIAFFCVVVIVTMLSALSFDPRLIWDRPQ